MALVDHHSVRWAVALAVLADLSLAHAQCTGDTSTHQAMLEKVRHGLVKLESRGGPDKPCRSEATGFILAVDEKGVLILTTQHSMPAQDECRKAGTQLFARFPQAPTTLVGLTRISESALDVALYRAAASDVTALLGSKPMACPLRLGEHLRPIDQIVYFGYFPGDTRQALPYGGRIDDDPVAGAHRQRICGFIDKGTSGGPALGNRGQVVGIVKERLESDLNGNPVVSKGWLIPAETARSVFATQLQSLESAAKYCLEGDGFDFSKAPAPQVLKTLPYEIEVPYHLSDIREDHDPLRAGDAAKWFAAQLGGQKTAQIRYAKTYGAKFAAVDGYAFDAVSGVEISSRNLPSEPIPTVECKTKDDCIQFSSDRRSMIVTYRLWSGPKTIDETRGWIDMVIKTKQSRPK